MIDCPACNHTAASSIVRCPECGTYLGATADFINFAAFWIAAALVVGAITFHYGILPEQRLGDAISEVKARDADGIRQIARAAGDHSIDPVGWDADEFRHLYLVAFTYIPAHENKDRHRLAVWWALEPDQKGVPPKVGSVDEFADKYLLPEGLAGSVPKAAELARKLAGHASQPIPGEAGGGSE